MAAYAIAEDNLLLGRIVVADSVNPIELTRSAWRAIAERAGCMNLDIEVLCSDKAEHQRHVEMRRSEEHTSELQSLMRISYAVFCLKQKITKRMQTTEITTKK